VTLLDPNQPWWLGTKGFAEQFGQEIDLEQLRAVPVQMVVGDQDVETWEINNPGHSNWMDGAERTGRTRIERCKLSGTLPEAGINVRFDVVPGVAHDGREILPVVKEFFAEILTEELIR